MIGVRNDLHIADTHLKAENYAYDNKIPRTEYRYVSKPEQIKGIALGADFRFVPGWSALSGADEIEVSVRLNLTRGKR